MAVTPKPKRVHVGAPISFRFPEDVAFQLRALTELSGEPQVRLIERLIRLEYADTKEKYPKELAQTEASLRAEKPTKAKRK